MGWANTATVTVFIGVETNNWKQTQSVAADLWFTNFRVKSSSAP